MSKCGAQTFVENPVRPEKLILYTCACVPNHFGEHRSTLDKTEICYVWEEGDDPASIEREACARIADTYQSTSTGKAIASLIRSRGQK